MISWLEVRFMYTMFELWTRSFNLTKFSVVLSPGIEGDRVWSSPETGAVN
jgi:hypothetical protein